ncbi:asparagine synthase (glutamine-hydrolyzing) [Aliikangiella coralliicola]|uniref:asparagine synthase (glutamine-hydrolyzing) n=1 Tax=Aliikangiella coralliicola TaxID=2592383 RepID=A0A545UHH0_9GAMM|nr:asparagine synthase (glutamine-hydrolyzing) [Aliikangiella coralliicola]TQV88909.1 asparagine synthase (glutamine-hydrolyzing) [Aliikangiella coralliicola]
MCGIAGIIRTSPNSTNSIAKSILGEMADQIIHRGPDESGIYCDEIVGFSHRRLSIIDLSSGQQPMFSPSRDISLVFNGEIFNYIELRDDLIKKGHQFITQSDTEVIIHLYQEYGLDFVQYLNGQFAIALWDSRQKRFVLVRDRVGICPLYYTNENGQLIFASEIKALKPALANGLTLCKETLDQIFTFWAPVSPNTIFENVFEVSPGQMLVIENGQLNSHKYWDWQFSQDDYLQSSESQQAEELHDLLIDATKIRLRADVPVGAYLSGGLDSSVLVAMIHHYGGVPLRTFSLNFSEAGFDEKSYQSSLIQHLQADHSHLMVKTEDIAQNFKQTIYQTETPILRTAPVPMGMLSSLVRQNDFKVVLTGEGADEVLGGYDIFKEAKVRQFWAVNANSSFRPLLLKKLYPYLTLPDSGQGTYLKRFFGEALEQPDDICFSHLPRWTTTAKAKRFYSQELSAELSGKSKDVMLRSLPEALKQMHPFNRAQYIESKSLMAGYLLTSQGDRMLAKNSVEGRFPFLDHRVIEFANKIPPKYKMKGLNEKNLLKKAMAKYLPAEIIDRHKQPYRAPDMKAMTGDYLGEELRHHLSVSEIEKNGLFDGSKVKFLMKKADSGKALSIPESQALVGILSTQVIIDQFI